MSSHVDDRTDSFGICCMLDMFACFLCRELAFVRSPSSDVLSRSRPCRVRTPQSVSLNIPHTRLRPSGRFPGFSPHTGCHCAPTWLHLCRTTALFRPHASRRHLSATTWTAARLPLRHAPPRATSRLVRAARSRFSRVTPCLRHHPCHPQSPSQRRRRLPAISPRSTPRLANSTC